MTARAPAPGAERLGVGREPLRLAEQINDNQLKLSALRRKNDDEAKVLLMNVKGIGSWSADIYLLMAMRRADIWPSGDLALATTVMELNSLEDRLSAEKLTVLAERWRPYRAVAARMLWQHYLAGRKRKTE